MKKSNFEEVSFFSIPAQTALQWCLPYWRHWLITVTHCCVNINKWWHLAKKIKFSLTFCFKIGFCYLLQKSAECAVIGCCEASCGRNSNSIRATEWHLCDCQVLLSLSTCNISCIYLFKHSLQQVYCVTLFLANRSATQNGWLLALWCHPSVCPSVCNAVHCGSQGWCTGLKVIPACSWQTSSCLSFQTLLL